MSVVIIASVLLILLVVIAIIYIRADVGDFEVGMLTGAFINLALMLPAFFDKLFCYPCWSGSRVLKIDAIVVGALAVSAILIRRIIRLNPLGIAARKQRGK